MVNEWTALADRMERQAATISELQGSFLRVERDAARWRRAHEIVEQERDTARESLRRLRDETDFDLFTVRDQLKQCRGEREQMTRDRDEWKARAEDAERERDAAEYAEAEMERERDEWKSHAVRWQRAWLKSAPARTVTREDVEKAIRAAFDGGGTVGEVREMADTVWSLVSGADPAVFVVRESDLPEVTRTYDGWTDGTRHGWEGTSETAMECVETHLEWARFYLAASRAIESDAEPADPVEQKAVELFEATDDSIWAWATAPVQTQDMYRAIAAHVLGQEA